MNGRDKHPGADLEVERPGVSTYIRTVRRDAMRRGSLHQLPIQRCTQGVLASLQALIQYSTTLFDRQSHLRKYRHDLELGRGRGFIDWRLRYRLHTDIVLLR
jgi:hypothetical protein